MDTNGLDTELDTPDSSVAAILRLEEVVAGYGKQTILHGLTYTVARSAITTVIGPNGAG